MRGRWDRWQLFHGFIVVDCFHRFGIEGEVQVPSVGKWLLERALGGHLGWNPHRHVLLETVERLDNRFRWYQPSDAALKKKVFDAIDERRLFVVRTRARSLHASPAPARKSASVGETTSAPPRVIHWIGIEVETSDGSDFGGLYRLELPGGQHESGRLGRGNKLRLEDIHPGTARLSFTVPGVRDNVYTLQATDCILSIARDAAVPWKEIWDHPKNEKLRERRASPHVLQAGIRSSSLPSRRRSPRMSTTFFRSPYRRRTSTYGSRTAAVPGPASRTRSFSTTAPSSKARPTPTAACTTRSPRG